MTQVHKPKTFDAVRVELRHRTPDEQRQRNEAAIAQLEAWLADESGYDERVWPEIKATIRANRLSERDPFHE